MKPTPAICAFLLFFNVSAAFADKSNSAIHQELKLYDVWVEDQMALRDLPGLSIGVVHNGELIWDKSYGLSNLDQQLEATSETLYRIASISKTFTATAIMQLRDAGKLKLSDPVRDHLPWFGLENEHERPITIWHLLTHTSGLPREPVELDWVDLEFPSREVMIEGIVGQQPVYAPETEWKYSNLGFTLAGEIIAEISGLSWEDYVQQNILDPLEMSRTVIVPPRSQPMLATGYSIRKAGQPRSVLPWVDGAATRPAGSIASSVADMSRYLGFHLAGGDELLSAGSKMDMQRVHWLFDSWDAGWGLGFEVVRKPGYEVVAHGGSLPGHSTKFAFAPEPDLGVVVFGNADDTSPTSIADMAFDLLVPVIKSGPDAETAEADPGLNRYVGRYGFWAGEYTVLTYRGELVVIEKGSGNPARSLMKLEPLGEHTFKARLSSRNYVFNDEIFRFIVGESGQATGFELDFGTMQRLGSD